MFLKTLNKNNPLLSTLLHPAGRRSFSRNSISAYVSAAETTLDHERKETNATFHAKDWQKLQTVSKAKLAKQSAQEAAEAEWLSQLRSPQQKEGIFAKISEIKDSDNEHLREVKGRIATLVKQELDALRFEEQLKKEQAERLAKDVYQEVKTKSNFFFKVDENKVNKNLKIFNVKAPGNHHRHPSVVLPHEHVHITHWFDTEGLNEEKMTEIYAYYSHMIDLHISQVRP
jgi:hypothetical protein